MPDYSGKFDVTNFYYSISPNHIMSNRFSLAIDSRKPIEERTINNIILEKDAKVLESPEKRNVCMTIINKVTKVNSDCINFITKHPFVVTAALTSVGVASGLASSAITKHNERKYEEDIFGD